MKNSLYALILLAASPVVIAQDGSERWWEHEAARAWLEAYDPTLLSRRIVTQFEFEDQGEGTATAKVFANGRLAVPLVSDLALGLQMEAPLVWGRDSTVDEEIGPGDLEARAGLVGRFSPRTRWGLAMNALFPTADEGLGKDAFELRAITALRHDLATWINIGANLEYTFTPFDEGDKRAEALEIKIPVTVKLADRYSAFASYNPRQNFVTDATRHRFEVALTRVFGADKDHSLTAGVEVPLSEDSIDWKCTLGWTWSF